MSRDNEVTTHGMRVSIVFDIERCDNKAEADQRIGLLDLQERTDDGVHLVKVSYIKYTETDVKL